MKPGQPKLTNHFFLPEDRHLFDYDQTFSVSSMWIELGMENVIATYDLFVRDLPKNRNFLLFGGLEEIVESIKTWQFSQAEIDFLLKYKVITNKAAKLFKKFKYNGDLWAMPEGTIFFPAEPVVRLTGPIWEVNLFSFFLMEALSSGSIPFSKAVRSFLVADGKIDVLACPTTRAHAHEASLKYGRAIYLLGGGSAMVPSFARKYNLPIKIISKKAYHAFIKSFPSEIQAMRAAASVFPHLGLMIDTYDYKTGIKNAITLARELKSNKQKGIDAVVIDSGKNLEEYMTSTRYVRRQLDKAGFKDIKITIAGNFQEYKIAKFIKSGAPADGVIIGTEAVTSSDDPRLEAVFKIAEFVHNGETHYSAKLTPGKESYPAKKQVFRKFKNGKIAGDTIGLENEKLGTPLLKQYLQKGKPAKKLPDLDEIKEYTAKQLKTLPNNLKRVDEQFNYKARISKNLQKLFEESRKQHLSKIK